jgi:hypothetical protein
MTKRSEQKIGLGRRPARIHRVGRLAAAAEVLENPFDPGDTAKRAERVDPRCWE